VTEADEHDRRVRPGVEFDTNVAVVLRLVAYATLASTVNRLLVASASLTAAGILVAAAGAATPYPPKAAGSGSEATAGSGNGAGVSFSPRFALATYDGTHYVFYLTQKPLACSNAVFAKPPYLTVTIVSGSPLVVGSPTPNTGTSSFVQVDFFVSRLHYYAVQPKVRLVLTRVDPRHAGVWHGRVTVPTTHFEGKAFAFTGTFAARWCGKD
jgi:hypothetical protein